MRIAFVTSSLAHGKDGVGDYTRDLAGACSLRGVSCTLLALNDRHIEGTVEEEQSSSGAVLETLRLSSTLPSAERFRAARGWIERHGPGLVSVQFVAYGFHPKGLVGNLGQRFAEMVGQRASHVMFHELWIGMERGTPWKRRMIGSLQQRGVQALVRRLRPIMIHTSNSTYATLLKRTGVTALILPHCGSIPVAADFDPRWLDQELVNHGVPESTARVRESCWRFGIFGSLHPGWAPEPLFGRIAEAARLAGHQVVIACIGRTGTDRSLWHELQRRYGSVFSFAALGERPQLEVSAFLQSIDFGIALTPWSLIGKSAATAAMLDHGVPVIVSSADADYGIDEQASASPLLYRLDNHLAQWLRSTRRQPPRHRLPDMAQQFLADLETATQTIRRPIAAGSVPIA